MFVLPLLLASRKSFAVSRWRRRICDLRDQIASVRLALQNPQSIEVCIRSRGLRNSIYEYAEERDPQENVETNAKSEQETLSVMKPVFLLFLCEPDSGEVWLKLVTANSQ